MITKRASILSLMACVSIASLGCGSAEGDEFEYTEADMQELTIENSGLTDISIPSTYKTLATSPSKTLLASFDTNPGFFAVVAEGHVSDDFYSGFGISANFIVCGVKNGVQQTCKTMRTINVGDGMTSGAGFSCYFTNGSTGMKVYGQRKNSLVYGYIRGAASPDIDFGPPAPAERCD